MKKKYIITKSSIIKRCMSDGQNHQLFTENERPCNDAVLEEIIDRNGNRCSRFFIEIDNTIEALDKLCDNYVADIKVSRNLFFPDYITLVICDDEG